MTFRQISQCLPAWLTAEIDKGAGTDEGAGQVVVREVVPTNREEQAAPVNPANGRPIVTASAKRRPTSAVAIGLVLVVDNGEGGRPTGGGNSRAAYRAATREGSRVREFLKLVVG
jgi:hypothetical protein